MWPESAFRGMGTDVERKGPRSARTTPPQPRAGADVGGEPATRDRGSAEPAAGGKRSQATQLLELTGDVEFFHTADDVPYARIERDGHYEVWPLGSKALRAWLSRRFHQAFGRAARSQALRDALDVLVGRALFDGSECPVYVRVAGDGHDIYLDLGDPLWQAVKITATRWEIVADPLVRFRRPKGLLHLPVILAEDRTST